MLKLNKVLLKEDTGAGEGEGFDLNDWLVDVGCNSVTHCDVAVAVMGEGATAALKRGTGEVDV